MGRRVEVTSDMSFCSGLSSPGELWGNLKGLRLCQFVTGLFIVAEEVVNRFKCVSFVFRH
jgi:hypothetical protein